MLKTQAELSPIILHYSNTRFISWRIIQNIVKKENQREEKILEKIVTVGKVEKTVDGFVYSDKAKKQVRWKATERKPLIKHTRIKGNEDNSYKTRKSKRLKKRLTAIILVEKNDGQYST